MLVILQQSVRPDKSGLQQLVLRLEVSVQQQPVLCQEVYCLRQLVLHMDCLSIWTCLPTRILCALVVSVYKSLCCTYACPSTRAFVLRLDVSSFKNLCCTCVCLSTRALGYTRRCLSTRDCAAPVRVCKSLCAAPGWTCLSTRACAAPVSFYKSLCVTPAWTCLSAFKSLCCTCATLSARAAHGRVWLHLSVSVYKSFVLNLDMPAYKSTADAAPVGVLTVQFRETNWKTT